MHKYEAVQNPSGEFILVKDNMQTFCPKLLPMRQQSQNKLNPAQIDVFFTRMPCSTGCPFANIEKKDAVVPGSLTPPGQEVKPEYTYTIECEGGSKRIALDKITLKEATKPAIITSMKP